MYKYEFVKIEMKKEWKLGKNLEPEQDYHMIIQEYSNKGWRLFQIFSPPTGVGGCSTYFELIFEKLE